MSSQARHIHLTQCPQCASAMTYDDGRDAYTCGCGYVGPNGHPKDPLFEVTISVASAALPTDDSCGKRVDTFGNGTYDGSEGGLEDDDPRHDTRESLPRAGGPQDPFGPDRLLSYAASGMPGDSLASPFDYDRMKLSEELWADADDGVFASKRRSLPTPTENSTKTRNGLEGLGNEWSGFIIEDQSNPAGFPSDHYASSGLLMIHTAANAPLVRELTGKLLKEFGSRGLTRRHVMAFLTKHACPQFLASDIIRCLHVEHEMIVPDALDNFPTRKASKGDAMTPSQLSASLRRIAAAIDNSKQPSKELVLRELRKVAAEVSGESESESDPEKAE